VCARQAVLGLALAAAGGMLTGSGTLGFMVGSSVGFVGATVRYYQSCLRQSLVALEQHPGLMRLHLAYNFPDHHHHHHHLLHHGLAPAADMTRDYWTGDFARQGNLIAAWQSASTTIDDIFDRRTQLLVDRAIRDSAAAVAAAAAAEDDHDGAEAS
jgi:hypothetical protein